MQGEIACHERIFQHAKSVVTCPAASSVCCGPRGSALASSYREARKLGNLSNSSNFEGLCNLLSVLEILVDEKGFEPSASSLRINRVNLTASDAGDPECRETLVTLGVCIRAA
jgi:hypothetical protein